MGEYKIACCIVFCILSAYFFGKNLLMRFGILVTLLLSIVLTGCFGTSGISLSKGNYDIEPPPSIHGAMRHIGKNDSTRIAIASFGAGKSKRFAGRIHNDSQRAGANDNIELPEMDGQITYNLPMLSYFWEWRDIYGTDQGNEWGAGFGLFPYPYVHLFGAINTSISEVGAFALLNASIESVDYEGVAVEAPGTYRDYELGDYDDSPRNVHETDRLVLRGNAEIGAFLNFFIKDFTLSYVPSVYFPWLFWNDLGEYNTTFFYPMLLMQDLQINYNFAKWSVGVGFKDIVSNSLSGNYWQVHLNVAYYF